VTAKGQEQLVDVVATGYGTTVREATSAALRSAVEQVVGTMIDATTIVENDKIIEDEILSHSAGMECKSILRCSSYLQNSEPPSSESNHQSYPCLHSCTAR